MLSATNIQDRPKSLSIIEARKKLTNIPELFEQEADLDVVAVTRRGRPVMAIMPWELYEALEETLEILGDEALMMQLRKSIEELKAGQLIPWEETGAGVMDCQRALKDAAGDFPSWQAAKLKIQSSKYTFDELITMNDELLSIDFHLKTSQLPYDLNTALELWLMKNISPSYGEDTTEGRI